MAHDFIGDQIWEVVYYNSEDGGHHNIAAHVIESMTILNDDYSVILLIEENVPLLVKDTCLTEHQLAGVQ